METGNIWQSLRRSVWWDKNPRVNYFHCNKNHLYIKIVSLKWRTAFIVKTTTFLSVSPLYYWREFSFVCSFIFVHGYLLWGATSLVRYNQCYSVFGQDGCLSLSQLQIMQLVEDCEVSLCEPFSTASNDPQLIPTSQHSTLARSIPP